MRPTFCRRLTDPTTKNWNLFQRRRFEPRPSTNSAVGRREVGRPRGSPSETKVRKAGYEPASMKRGIPPKANSSETFFERNRKQQKKFIGRFLGIWFWLLSRIKAYLFNARFRSFDWGPCRRSCLTQLCKGYRRRLLPFEHYSYKCS